MTWSQIGWVMIALGAVSLVGFSFFIKDRFPYRARKIPAVEVLVHRRVTAIERGLGRHVILGDRFWSRAYPGLGLHAVTVLQGLVHPEDKADGGQIVSGGAGVLMIFAQQIVQGCYQDGFSAELVPAGTPVILPGPTPFSFLAGLLPEISMQTPGSLALFGDYGPTAALWTEAGLMKGSHDFAAAGSITAQAALYLNVHDLLIGEEIFMLPGLIEPTPENRAGWITEDILRVLLITLLVVAAALKMAGVL